MKLAEKNNPKASAPNNVLGLSKWFMVVY